MRIAQDQIITSGDMSGTISSEAVDVAHLVAYSIQAVFTGSPVGVLKLQCSNDITDPGSRTPFVPTNWTDIAGSSQSVSAAGDHAWNVLTAGYRFVRAVWTPSSGTGVLGARFFGKGG